MGTKLKIVLVNPPVIRSRESSPANNFKIEGAIFRSLYYKIPGAGCIWTKLGLGKGVRYGVRAGSRWPWTTNMPHGGPPYPFFLGYAAANLKENGYAVAFIDAVVDEEYSYPNFFRKVKNEAPDIVIIETSTPTIDIDLWVAEKISAFAEVCLAGPHVTEWDELTLSRYNYVKYVLKGEYAQNCLEMVRTRRPGIYEAIPVTDLDMLPFPYRDFPAATKYYEPTMPTPRPQLQMYASKGCPFKCIYCMWPQVMYNGAYVPRPAAKVAEEIIFCKERFGYKSVLFDDDTFNIGDERISELCDRLQKIGLPWTMMGRLDTSPLWLFDKMVDSGCVGMRFGIETFDLKVSSTIKKGLKSDKAVEVLKHISNKHPNLMIHVTMMKDLPGQTDAIHKCDMDILAELGYSVQSKYRNYQLSSCVPFPGTELYNQLTREGHDLADWKLYDGGQDTVMKGLDP
jgi:Fe-S oxidoreductase